MITLSKYDNIVENKGMVMSNIRLVVVVRKDLQLSPGLLAAQVSHIADQFMREKLVAGSIKYEVVEREWAKAPYISVLAVNTLDELVIVQKSAESQNLAVRAWEDVVPSEILQRPIRCLVGISIGPDDFDAIKLITGTLPLY